MRRPTWLPLLVAALLPIAGCGVRQGGPVRSVISGRVTFAGRPVPRGRIEFEPDATRGNRGPAGVAEIVDGRYSTTSRFGAVAGPQVVRISGYDGRPRAAMGETWADPNGSPLFTDHLTEVTLPGGSATADFHVPGP